MTVEDHQDIPIPMSLLIYAFERNYIEGMVEEVLGSRGELATGARDALNGAIANGIKLDGFRDASRAAPELLQDCVLDELEEGNDRIAAALFRSWVELRKPLRKRVKDHLRSQNLSVDGPDLRERMFKGIWPHEEWMRGVDAVAASDSDIDRQDAGLMLCYVSGLGARPTEDEIKVDSEFLSGMLEQLRELPSDASEWAEIDDFVESAIRISSAKAADRAVGDLRAFLERLTDITDNFEAELQYLEIDMDADRRTLETAESATLLPQSKGLLKELRERLEEYSAVFPRADSRTEESQRAAERQRCEDAVLDVMERWDRYAAEKLELDEEPEIEVGLETSQGVAGEAAGTVPLEEYEALQDNLDALTKETESLKVENSRLAHDIDGLRVDNEALDGLNDRLREELEDSRRTEENWRRTYVSEKVAIADGDEASPAPPSTVKEAIVLAEKTFADRLVFALNSKSNRRSPFQRPEEVFDALAWLATVYFEKRASPGKPPGFDKLLKESCPGWSYKPKQTEVTKEQFEEWYTTTLSGQRYELDPHIGKGTSFDPQRTVRIAFAWDGANDRVVVGFIGLHQRSRRS